MALAAIAGVSASNSSAATSLATGTYSATAGHDILVAVAIAASGVTVSSVTDTLGNSYTLKSSATNSGNVHVELWQTQNIAAGGSNAITANVSGSSLLAIAVEEYAGTYNVGFAPLNRTGWGSSASDVTFGAVANAIDGNTSTIWATAGTFPQWAVFDMLTAKTFDTVTFLARQDGFQDNPGSIEIYVSSDGVTWGSPVYTISGLPNNNTLKIFGPFTTQTQRYVKYNNLANAAGARAFSGASEINVGTTTAIPSQNTANATGSGFFPGEHMVVQDGNGTHVAAIAFACSSGDTFASSSNSSIRQSVVPALTSVAVAIADVTQATSSMSVLVETKLNASRQWAVASVGLRVSGGAAGGPVIDYVGHLPVDGTPMQKEQRYFGTMPSSVANAPGGGGGTGNYGYTS